MISRAWILSTCLALGCTQTIDGMGVELGLMQAPDFETGVQKENEIETRVIEDASGMVITLSQAFVTVSSIQLVPCDAGFQSANKSIPTLAHGESTPLLLAVPHITGLWLPDYQRWPIGQLAPPPGDYCSALIELGPADDDAIALPESVDMVDTTLFIQGECESAGITQEFEIKSDWWAMATLELVDDAGRRGITISEENPWISLSIGFQYSRWFEGVDWHSDSQNMAMHILSNIRDSIVHVEKS